MVAVQPSFEACGTPLFDVTFVIVDLETTGLSPERDRITEFGAVKVRRGEVLGEFQTLVHPGRPIPPAITAVTGISDAMVAGHPPVAAVLPLFLEFARGAVLVAHNATFDVGFLDAALVRHGFPRLDHPTVDTARVARRLLRDEVRNVRLATLAAHLRARIQPEHRALTDARATVDVLHGLLERAGSLGATTLEDLQAYMHASSDLAFRKIGLVRDAPAAPGTYRFLDERGEVLYVGKATDLRQRLRQYFGGDRRRRIADLVRETASVTWERTPTVLEAEVLEVRAIQHEQPRYNRRSKHPQRAVYVKLTHERFPRLSIVQAVRDDGGLYLGPVASRRVAERFVEAVHEALPLRQCSMRIRVAQDHASCVLKDLGRCGAPCDGTQDADAYGQVAGRYRRAVTGDARDVIDPLRRRMGELADACRYERATGVRQRLHAVADVLGMHRELAGLVAAGELMAFRRVEDPHTGSARVEAVRVRHGRLVGTVTAPGSVSPAELRTSLETCASGERGTGPPGREDVEEVSLVHRWLTRDGVRPLWVEGEYASWRAGGAELAATRREARQVARQIRRDHQRLAGDKVRARTDQTSSNQGVNASGDDAGTVPSRPSQLTRTR